MTSNIDEHLERIFLSPPEIGPEEINQVNKAVKENWLSIGPEIGEFESEFSKYHETTEALSLNSGTSAVHLAVKAVGVSRGDTVFCSSLSFIASANPVLYEGGEPVFIDSDEETWNLSPKALERAFDWAKKENRLPKAVLLVHIYGRSAKISEIQEICRAYNTPLLEDACEVLGAEYNDKKLGCFGSYSAFSFNGNKIITSSAGGMLISGKGHSLTKPRLWASQGKEQGQYEHKELGYNYVMSNIQACLGLAQFKKLDKKIENRKKVFEIYTKEFAQVPSIKFQPHLLNSKPNYWMTAAQIKNKAATPKKIVAFFEEQKIQVREVWKPLHRQELYKNCRYFPHAEGTSVSDHLFETGICLPSGSELSASNQSRVIDCLKKFL